MRNFNNIFRYSSYKKLTDNFLKYTERQSIERGTKFSSHFLLEKNRQLSYDFCKKLSINDSVKFMLKISVYTYIRTVIVTVYAHSLDKVAKCDDESYLHFV